VELIEVVELIDYFVMSFDRRLLDGATLAPRLVPGYSR
jgi:hypothetical protein